MEVEMEDSIKVLVPGPATEAMKSLPEEIVCFAGEAKINDVERTAVYIKCTSNDIARLFNKQVDVRYQYIGHFPETGVLISLQATIGHMVVETYFDGYKDEDMALLELLRKQSMMYFLFFDEEASVQFVRTRNQNLLIRQELGILLDRAENVRDLNRPALGKKRDWPKTVESFQSADPLM
jgi:hypothetical protein